MPLEVVQDQTYNTTSKIDPLLTVKELCDFLKKPRSWVYQMSHRKRIPCIKLQGSLRFRYTDIETWLKNQEVGYGDP